MDQGTSTTSLCGVNPDTNDNTQRRFGLTRNRLIALICLLIVVVVGVGVGIYFGVTSSGDSSDRDSINDYVPIPIPTPTPGAPQVPESECAFTVCGECHTALKDAMTSAACDAEEAFVVQVLVERYFLYEPLILESDSVTISGDQFVTEGNSVPIIVAAFAGEARGLIEYSSASSQRLSLKSLSLDGNGQLVSAIRTQTSASVDFRGEQVSFKNFRSANDVDGVVIYLEKVGSFTLDAESSASGNVAGNSDSGCPDKGGHNAEYCGGCTGYYGGAPIYLESVSGVLSFDGDYRDNTNYFNHGQGGVLFIGMLTGAGSSIAGTFDNNKATEGGAFVIDTIDCDGEFSATGMYQNNAAEDFYGHCGSRGGAITIRRVDGGTTVTIDGTFENNDGGAYGGVLRNDRILNNGRINLYGTFTSNKANEGNVANMRTLASGSVFQYKPSGVESIPADDIAFSTDDCKDTSTADNEITCEN